MCVVYYYSVSTIHLAISCFDSLLRDIVSSTCDLYWNYHTMTAKVYLLYHVRGSRFVCCLYAMVCCHYDSGLEFPYQHVLIQSHVTKQLSEPSTEDHRVIPMASELGKP